MTKEIDLKNLTIESAHESLKKGEYSVQELCDAYLAVIAEKNPDINAYLEIFDDIKEQAELAQKRFDDGTATLLTGIPIAVKDNMLIKGKKVTAGSKILEGYVASYSSTAIENLQKENPVFLGRTNMDEFAMGSSTENSAYGVTKNPHNLKRVSGGTSGGSAAAVAANMALIALGSDTGGSVRQPASFCGIVGLKPTYGAVSRYGLIADTSSFDQIGPMAKNIRDAEIVFSIISGKDPMDATSKIFKNKKVLNKKIKIGIPKKFIFRDGVDKEVLENFSASIEKIKSLGYEIVDIEIPLLEYSLAVYYILQMAEVSTNLERFDGIRYGLSASANNLFDVYAKTRGSGLGKEARRRILLGTYVLSHGYYDAYYRKADNLRKEITKIFTNLFKVEENGVDFIVLPTSPVPAFKIGEKTNNPMSMYLADIFTVPMNIAGIPGISIPTGFNNEELPLSLQIIGPQESDEALFAIGKELERVLQ